MWKKYSNFFFKKKKKNRRKREVDTHESITMSIRYTHIGLLTVARR
jgi:hypothetical protein